MTGAGRVGFGSGFRHASVAALTTWLTMLSWSGFSQVSSTYLAPLLVLGQLIALVGAGLRWLRAGGVVTVLAQVLTAVAFINLDLSGSLIPRGTRWDEMAESLRDAVETAQLYAAPVPAQADSIHPMMLVFGAVCLLLVDVAACTLHRVPLAGLPLLTVYAASVSLLGGGVPWWVFVAGAAGFLAMLFLHEDDQVSRWGRPLGRSDAAADASGFGVRTGTARSNALSIGAAATGLAVILPVFIPTLSLSVFGNGPGNGKGDVRIENPFTDMKRDLSRGEDVPLLRVTSDGGGIAYLRIAALTVYSGASWTPGDRDIPQSQQPNGPMPPLVGVNPDLRRRETQYTVSAYDNFDSIWLPVLPAVSNVQATGNWRYDSSTMDFLAADDSTDTAGLDYTMTGVQLDLEGAGLAAAPAATGELATRFTDLPGDFPKTVADLATKVTADQPTRFQKAVALQDWFRRDGGFRYDLEATSAGNGNAALLSFFDEKVGYCEQFASAMAVMARSLGIPARVAVGFLRPDQIGPATYEYSAWDLHAWPELFFPGYGWVRFEPTPGVRAGGVPSYTRDQLPDLPAVDPSSSATGNPALDRQTRSASPGASVTQRDRGAGSVGDSPVPWRWILAGLGTAVLLAGLGTVPRLLRRWRRDRRWATAPGPETAWRELRDDAIDLGLRWPTGLSPRATGRYLAQLLARPVDGATPERPARGPQECPEAADALDRLVQAVELHRYARPGAPGSPGASMDGQRERDAGQGEGDAGVALRADVELCAGSLAGGVSRMARRRAAWLPRSLVGRTAGRTERRGSVEVVGYGGVIDHVG